MRGYQEKGFEEAHEAAEKYLNLIQTQADAASINSSRLELEEAASALLGKATGDYGGLGMKAMLVSTSSPRQIKLGDPDFTMRMHILSDVVDVAETSRSALSRLNGEEHISAPAVREAFTNTVFLPLLVFLLDNVHATLAGQWDVKLA